MSRNVIAIVSSVLFVVLAALLVVVPVPFVTWRPGQTIDVLSAGKEGPLVEVTGLKNFDTPGKLLMTTVSTSRVDSSVSLPEALVAYLAPDSDAMPRDVIYAPGKSDQEVREEAVAMMDTSRSSAMVAALRAAGQSVTEMPMVASVVLSGPANGKLVPGDLIQAVDGEPVATVDAVRAAVRQEGRRVGDPVVFKVLREGATQTLSIVTIANSEAQPSVGITLGVGYEYAPQVVYRIDPGVVGPSAGLVFALAIYDKITEGDLLGDKVVAATGEMDPAGQVKNIGGIQEKVKGAEKAGASVFLLPAGNCDDLAGLSTELRLVPVATLKDAIAALQLINEGKSDVEVPSCG